jgi:hypothetical protein
MTWGEEARGREDEFAAKSLEPARYLDAESTATLGIGAGAPDVDAQGESAGAIDGQASSGEGVWRRRLAPHHRDAVKRFFSGPKRE